MTQELSLFVKEALAKGASRADIHSALTSAGWQEDEITSALGAYADMPFVVPVPRRKPYLSAREAFMYLVMFTTLYISAFNFGSLLFSFIDDWFPEIGGYSSTGETLRFAISALLVAFPLYLWLQSSLQKGIGRDPEKRSSRIRGWLTYLTLFVAASVIIGDIIALIYSLLGGDTTLRFVLKSLTVLFIAGMIFGYYLWDSRNSEKSA
jgi:Domain of unknown function (DUF5671)